MKTIFVRKNNAVQNVHKGHDQVQKYMYVQGNNAKKHALE